MKDIDIEELKAMREAGVQRKEIAEYFNVKPSVISDLAKIHNLPYPKRSKEYRKQISDTAKRIAKEQPEKYSMKHCHTEEIEKKARLARINSEVWRESINTPETMKKQMITKIERYGNEDGIYLCNEGGVMAYRGKFGSFKNPQKYVGNIENVTFRSLWERNAMIWLDENPNVKEWASEEIFFRYDHPVTGKSSRYFPDFYVKMTDGQVRIVEIKPQKEVDKPKEPKRKTKGYINEVATWLTNQEKWKEAKYHCDKNNMTFEVWTEHTLDEMGIQKKRSVIPLSEKVGKQPGGPKHKPVNRSKSKRPRPTRRS